MSDTRVNLMSAVFSVIGVLTVHAIGLRRPGNPVAAAVGAVALAVSHTWWWMSSSSEVYTFAAVMLLSSLLLWLHWTLHPSRRMLAAAALATGLAASAHASGALLIAAVALHLAMTRRLGWRDAAVAIGSATLGAAPFLSIGFNAMRAGGWPGVIAAFHSVNPFVHVGWLGATAKAAALFVYQFPSAALVLIGVGLIRMWRSGQEWDRLVLVTLAAFFGWAFTSRIADVFNA